MDSGQHNSSFGDVGDFHSSAVDEMGLNREVARIANLMLHDNVSADEQDIDKLDVYVNQVNLTACNISESDENRIAKARNVVYEALLYRKMKNTNHETVDNSSDSSSNNNKNNSILDRGSDFGAGFS